MLRIIVQTDDAGMAGNVGGHVLTTHKTFMVDAPEIEEFLTRKETYGTYGHRQVIGVEVVEPPEPYSPSPQDTHEDEQAAQEDAQHEAAVAAPVSDPEKFTRCNICTKEIPRPAWCEVGQTIICDDCIPF